MPATAIAHYNFGVEIELVARPHRGPKASKPIDWFYQLAQGLRDRGIQAIHDDNWRYCKHPEYYSSNWFVTRDASLLRTSLYVSMEVVSPILTTQEPDTDTISDFWEAVNINFDLQRHSSCGGHIHVTPHRSGKFAIDELKQIAFASVIYEDYVASILSSARRGSNYCKLNSRSTSDTGEGCRLSVLLLDGKTSQSLQAVNSEIRDIATEKELCNFMQKDRNVLWNFQNIYPDPSGKHLGTVEFRGCGQFLNTRGIMSWVAFTVGFMNLALEMDFLSGSSFSSSSSNDNLHFWWTRIRAGAEKSNMSVYLPDDYNMMQKV